MEASNIYQEASATDRWLFRTEKYGYTAESLSSMPVSKLPYSILSTFSNLIGVSWSNWSCQINQLKIPKMLSANEFITHISQPESAFNVGHLIDLVKKVNQAEILSFLICGAKHPDERRTADQDASKGFMDEIEPKTLAELTKKIDDVATGFDWRYLADGLGFDTHACYKFKDGSEMLRAWLSKYPEATVQRLYFEASFQKSSDICSYLEAIPLAGIPQKNFSLPADPFKRRVTRFDLKQLNLYYANENRLVKWSSILKRIENKSHSFDIKTSCNFLWQNKLGNLSKIIEFLNGNREACSRFIQEIQDGIFEPKTKGGISYAQVAHLSKVENYVAKNHMFKKMLERNIDVEALTEKHLSGNLVKKDQIEFLDKEMSFKDFVFLFWQSRQCKHLNLMSFLKKMKNILETTLNKNQELACPPLYFEAFLSLSNEIKPWRSYTP